MNKKPSVFSEENIFATSIIVIFIWVGFVCSISFMEAWLKFRAPNVTLEIGMGIGRLVFSALNRVEWAFMALLVLCVILGRNKSRYTKSIFFYVPIAILLVQTFVLLPVLIEKAEAISQGLSVSKSFHHFYFIFLEVAKVISLFFLGVKALKHLLSLKKVHTQINPASQ